MKVSSIIDDGKTLVLASNAWKSTWRYDLHEVLNHIMKRFWTISAKIMTRPNLTELMNKTININNNDSEETTGEENRVLDPRQRQTRGTAIKIQNREGKIASASRLSGNQIKGRRATVRTANYGLTTRLFNFDLH
jgi:hypothetical protein